MSETKYKYAGMDLMGLFAALGVKDKQIEAVLIKPIRNGEWYVKGRVIGYKSGLWGGGHYNYQRNKKNGETISRPYSYASNRNHWIKKPKVHVEYSIGLFGKTMHTDWVNVDNCTFNIVDENGNIVEKKISTPELIDQAARSYAGIPLDRAIDEEERYFQQHKCQVYDAFIAGTQQGTSEAILLLKKMHKSALYKLGPEDDRPTHLPHELFIEVEEFLEKTDGK